MRVNKVAIAMNDCLHNIQCMHYLLNDISN